MLNRPLHLEALRAEFRLAKPFPFVKIDDFLDPGKAAEIVKSYPTFDRALEHGTTFTTVNERKKIQICDAKTFPPAVAELNRFLASPGFLKDLSYITAIPNILADEELVGGGIHITGPGGRLDVHVDFNFIEARQLHRRLNLLIYLNQGWQPGWGGQFQLWDKDVKNCMSTFDPIFNRCVIFETSEISFHGVVPITAQAQAPRKSFATYYYTKEAPNHWTGKPHSTIFKARPDETVKNYFLMPAESARRAAQLGVRRLKNGLKSLIKD
jgi:hypothetical protein